MANLTGKGGTQAGEPSRNPKGRPRNEERNEINAMLDKAMPLTDVVARLAECTKHKQPWAVKLWLAYRWGEPIQRAEVSGDNGGPIEYKHAFDYANFGAAFGGLIGGHGEGDAAPDGDTKPLDPAATDGQAGGLSGVAES